MVVSIVHRGRKTLERAREGTKTLLLQTKIPSESSIYNRNQLNIHTRSISSVKMNLGRMTQIYIYKKNGVTK